MSILMTLEAMPNRIKALAEVATSENGALREELIRRFMPAAEKPDQFKNLLRETIRLGILEENKETKIISLGSDISKKQISNRTDFHELCRTCLVPSDGTEPTGNESFPRALAWLLARPTGPHLIVGEEFKGDVLNDLNDDDIYELTNASRSSILVYWAQALGFVEWLRFNEKDYCNPDPTRVLAHTLDTILEKKHPTPISSFIEKLGRGLPVFETGRIRNEVEARLKIPRGPDYISRSTSLALSRLELRGTIKLEHLADAPTLLLSSNEERDRPVSHITLLKS
ncbi:protein DpdG [Rhodospirillales bacterium]|nr:protein DpdG [Rhodospirillales bacterium]